MHMRARILCSIFSRSPIAPPGSDWRRVLSHFDHRFCGRCGHVLISVPSMSTHMYVIYYIILDVLPVSASYYLPILRATNPSCYAVIDYYDLL